jgi:hypothetical protein
MGESRAFIHSFYGWPIIHTFYGWIQMPDGWICD